MRKFTVFILALVLMLLPMGCKDASYPGNDAPSEHAGADSSERVEAVSTANDFVLTLHADKDTYSTDEAIHIGATLEYVGQKEKITIWHGLPYIVFSITDGADFNVNGIIQTVLTSSVLYKGEQYHFDYVKSGGYDPDAPDGAFWESFFQEKELRLPAGTYTISADGAFYLSDRQHADEKGPSCQLKITVE